ncbi:MAG: hypothetical protein ACSHX8_03365 [Opitutaceae bacterium]
MLEKIIAALIAGLFGLLPALFEWLSNRSKKKLREARLTSLQDELNFLERWSKLANQSGIKNQEVDASGSSTNIKPELYRLLNEYRSFYRLNLRKSQVIKEISVFRKIFLLFKPHNFTAWLVHTLYYFLFCFVSIALIIDYMNPTFDPDTGENEFIYLVIGFAVLLGPPIVILQRLAIRLWSRQSGLDPQESEPGEIVNASSAVGLSENHLHD